MRTKSPRIDMREGSGHILFLRHLDYTIGGELMITHVVLAKLKDQSVQNVQSTQALLRSMNGRIPSMRYFEVGNNVGRSEWAYDIALIAKFDDLDGLSAYQTHPVHLPVSNKLRELAAIIAIVDYKSD
jgi:hypothetical protein